MIWYRELVFPKFSAHFQIAVSKERSQRTEDKTEIEQQIAHVKETFISHAVMTTGDIKNNLRKLEHQVKMIKYPDEVDVKG